MQTLVWGPGRDLADGELGGELRVADSFLLRDGTVRGLSLHRTRFTRACLEEGVPAAEVDRFWRAAMQALPTVGEHFPRLELVTGPGISPRLGLRVRSAPPLTRELRLWVPEEPDPRRLPRRKGPDLELLGRWRDRARQHGADDALLVSPAGYVLEAAHSCLLWWEEDRLCLPAQDLPTLASVTRELVLDRALDLRVPVVGRRCRPASLDGREVWAVNALHGIRTVTGWAGPVIRPGTSRHAAQWCAWLAGTGEAVGSGAAAG